MRFAIATALTGVTAMTLAAAAQTPPAAPGIARTVVAGTKLPSLGSAPLYFGGECIDTAGPEDQRVGAE
jgi:hypothetical protein